MYLRIRVRFIRIDNWAGKRIFINLNDKEIFSKTFGDYEGLLNGRECGNSSFDSSYMLTAEAFNSGNSLTLKLSSDIDENGSWGIGEYSLSFSNNISRTDLVSTIYTNGGFDSGEWSDVFCPENSWVRSVSALVSLEKGTGIDIVGIYFIYNECFDKKGNFVTQLNSSGKDMGKPNITTKLFCPNSPKNFLFGYKLKSGDFGLGLSAISITCLDRTTIRETIPYHPQSKNDSYWAYCPEGSAVCGMRNRFTLYKGPTNYDNGHTNLHLHCCKTCEEDEGLFFDKNTKNCLPCHYTCKTCEGFGSNLCKSCYHKDRKSVV